MIVRDDLDRRLTAWFAADAAPREPEYLLGSVLARTARTRRRPAWLIPERWIPMSAITSRAAATPRAPWRLVGALALLILALVVGAMLIVGNQPRELPAPFGPAANGLVAYAADGDIYTVDPSTANRRAAVTGPAVDRDPVWSLDGTRFVFLREEDGGARLHSARADGTDVIPVTDEAFLGLAGYSFSPDGSSVLFAHQGPVGVGSRPGIAVAAADGTGWRLLQPRVGMLASGPTYRPPDGREILFIGEVGGGNGLYVMNADGTNVRELIAPSNDRLIGEARYSPDGSRIAYYFWDPFAAEFTVRTHVMSADGTGDRLVDRESPALWDAGVAWSNDGTRLAIVRGYTAAGYDDARAAVVPLDGSGPGVETNPSVSVNDECCSTYAWSPDDATILWTPTDASGRFVQQLLIDPATGQAQTAGWTAATGPAWQRVAP